MNTNYNITKELKEIRLHIDYMLLNGDYKDDSEWIHLAAMDARIKCLHNKLPDQFFLGLKDEETIQLCLLSLDYMEGSRQHDMYKLIRYMHNRIDQWYQAKLDYDKGQNELLKKSIICEIDPCHETAKWVCLNNDFIDRYLKDGNQ